MRWKLSLIFILIIIVGGIAVRGWRDDARTGDTPKSAEERLLVPQPSEISAEPLPSVGKPAVPIAEPSPATNQSSNPLPPLRPQAETSSFIDGVPFTAQAPTGQWSDPIFQNGCEEASITMAAYWISGKPLTPAVAEREMRAQAAYEEEWLGHSVDTSIEDTRLLLEKQYGISARAEHTDEETLPRLREALAGGAIVIVPADGRKLGNPYFRPPGPVRHMLVVIGYDAATREFITHDPGTKRGANYRYGETVLFEAIRDYPTGEHLPFRDDHKVILIIPKS